MNGLRKSILLRLLVLAIFLSGCNSTVSKINNLETPSLQPTQLIPPEPEKSPQVTPTVDCKKIAFVLNKADGADIYSICSDGSQLTQLTNSPSDDLTPAWSPDGTEIAYASGSTGKSEIYIMNADGSDPIQLTTEDENDMPIWLPGGLQIAFRSTDGKGLWWWRNITIKTKEISQLTQPSYDFFFQTPAWSPDGKKLAYMSLAEQQKRNDGASQIHVKNVDGQNDRALTQDTWANIHPVWSPDGTKLAFLSERDGTYNVYALYVMASDGTNLKRLTEPVYSEVDIPSWSPDGQEIAINSETAATIGNIDIVDVNTGNKRELLQLKNGETALYPSWQP